MKKLSKMGSTIREDSRLLYSLDPLINGHRYSYGGIQPFPEPFIYPDTAAASTGFPLSNGRPTHPRNLGHPSLGALYRRLPPHSTHEKEVEN
ncbi:hypothetical protein CEXT_82071 [Caerostris extrusa]|uniref:Uncharacterized protein n=1 Tax=Caerostris extrusa TaxID=172846 RepID=A0AAV4YD44_CAEEX|nr:hypothetical protein CEXT_82071 [Caerostris extrusa]